MLAAVAKNVEIAHKKLNGHPAVVETKFDGERMQVRCDRLDALRHAQAAHGIAHGVGTEAQILAQKLRAARVRDHNDASIFQHVQLALNPTGAPGGRAPDLAPGAPAQRQFLLLSMKFRLCCLILQVHLVDGQEVHWFSRQGHEHGAKSSYSVLDGIVRQQCAVGNLVLDGELIVWRPNK